MPRMHGFRFRDRDEEQQLVMQLKRVLEYRRERLIAAVRSQLSPPWARLFGRRSTLPQARVVRRKNG